MKGLICFIGCAATIVLTASGKEDKRGEAEVISHGTEVDIAKHLAPGHVTIVDFYADWCGPCRLVSPPLEQMAQTDRDVALRKIDIVEWTSPVAKQYHVFALPQVNVYSRKGELVGIVRGVDVESIQQHVAEAKTK